MSKRGRKRKDRRKGGANHGKRPNACLSAVARGGSWVSASVPA